MMKRTVVSCAAAAAAIALGLTASSSSHSAGPAGMPTAAQWAPMNVTLGPPTGPPAVAQQAAAAAAGKALNAAVLQGQLYHCHVPGNVPPVDADCYVELVDPSQVAGFAGSYGQPDPPPVAWAAVLVDATTGEPIRAFAASE